MAAKPLGEATFEEEGPPNSELEADTRTPSLPDETKTARRSFRRDLGALAVILAFAVSLCWPILGGRVPVASNTLALWPPWSQLPHEPITNTAIADSALLYLSWNVYERDAIHDGEWPLWDPYTFSGTPFAANSQSQLYYPLTWLLWLLPLSLAIQALTLFNFWFSGAGMYLLCRHFGLSIAASLVAAFGFAGSGMLQLALELPGVATPYGWLPWMLLALNLAIEEKRAKWTALATLACGLQLVSGNLQWCLYSYFALACWTGWRLAFSFLKQGVRGAVATLVPALIALGGGLALAAVHLFPLFELNSLSTRGTKLISSHSGPLYALLRLVMPEYFGTSVGDVGSPLVFNDLWYVGLGVLMLAALALVLPGQRHVWLWSGMALFAVLVTYGVGPFLYVRWLPGMNSLLPARIGYLFIFSVCLLGALGLDAWIRVCRTTPKRALISLAGVLALLTVILLLAPLAAKDSGAAPTPALLSLQAGQMLRAWVWLGVFGVLLASYLLLSGRQSLSTLVSLRGATHTALAGVVLLGAVFIDLLTVAPGYNAFVAPERIVPPSPAVDWLREHASLGRLMPLGTGDRPPTLVPNVQLLYGLQSVAGYDSLHTARYEEYWASVDPTIRPAGGSTPYADVFVRPQANSSTLASLLSVRYVASAAPLVAEPDLREVYTGEVVIYENRLALPRAFVVSNAVALPHDKVLAELTKTSFEPSKTVLFEAGSAPPVSAGGEPTQQSAAGGSAQILSYKRNGVSISVDAPAQGWLVLADQNYPGWGATVDGSPKPIYTADYLLRSVQVGPGHHIVVFSYVPTNYYLALAVTLASLVGVILAIGYPGFVRIFRNRARKEMAQ